jgi:hypothetical protein
MQRLIQQASTFEDAKDTWTYIWGNTTYAPTKFYHLPFQNVHPPKNFIWIWDSSCANKIRVFAWLLLGYLDMGRWSGGTQKRHLSLLGIDASEGWGYR